jgi:hypothetical protein
LARPGDYSRWSGRLFLQTEYADLAALTALAGLATPFALERGQGALRAWLQFDRLRSERLTADVAAADVIVKLAPAAAPLALASLHGRFTQQALGGAWAGGHEIAFSGLTLATADGLQIAPTDLRLRLAPARGGQANLALPLAEVEILPALLPVGAAFYNTEYAMDIPVAPSLHLVGVEVSSRHARPGERLRVTLTWQARAFLNEDFYLSLGLIRQGGGDIHALTLPRPLVSSQYPTLVWRPGETLRVNYPFLLSAALESGEYILGLRLLTFPDQRVISEIALQKLNVEARIHRFAIPPIEKPLSLHFGDSILLLGYDHPVVSIPDREIRVRLYWQASAPLEDSFIVFLHLVDKSNAIVAQIDTFPGNGDAPTTGWVVGEVIMDTLRLPLPATLPAGNYRLILGMYHSVSGTRLPIAGPLEASDSFVLEEIEIAD